MTVQTNLAIKTYAGNGVTLGFPVPFRFLANSQLKVTLFAPDGSSVVQVSPTNYSVTGARDPNGGNVTMVVAPPAGYTLTIQRNMPFTQLVDYRANDPFPEESAENIADERTMEAQQINEVLGRSLKLPASLAGFSGDLPGPSPLHPLVWNAAGTGLENGDILGTGDMLLRPDLADPADGAALVAFRQVGTGAVARTSLDKMRERISVKDFGATGDGVTDDTAAIQAAINYVQSITTANTNATNGRLYIPHGSYLISDTLTISQPITVFGDGTGDTATANAPGTGRAMTQIIANAAMADKPMVRVIAAVSGQVLIQGEFSGVQLQGQGFPSYGFHGSSLSRWKIDCATFRCRLAGMRLDDLNATLNSFNEIHHSYTAGVDASTIGSHGLWIIGTQGTSAGNPQQRIHNSAFTVNGDNLRFESDVDNAIVYYATGIVTGTGRSLALVAGASVPRVNFFLYWAGGIGFVDAGTFGNVIYATSSETTTITGTGQYHLQGIVDYGTGGMWQTNRYLLSDELTFTPRDFNTSGLGAGATEVNLSSVLPCWTLDAAANEAIATSRRIPKNWRNCRVTRVLISYSFNAAPGVGTAVVLRTHFNNGAQTSGSVVGVPVQTTQTVAVPSNTAGLNFIANIPFASPITVTNDSILMLAIQRMGTDGADTAAGDLFIASVTLVMESLGPQSVGSGSLVIPSMGT